MDDLNDPVDHDFFDDDIGPAAGSPVISSRDRNRPGEGKQNQSGGFGGGGGGMDWTSLALSSARSTTSTGSKKEIQAKIPTGTPRDGDYIYSSDDDFNFEEKDDKNIKPEKRDSSQERDSQKTKEHERKETGSTLKERRNLKSAGPRRDRSPKAESPRQGKKKAGKGRKRADSYSSDSDSYSDSYTDSYSSYSSSYTSASDSESEITDVSPLPSPHQSPHRERRQKKGVMDMLKSAHSPNSTGDRDSSPKRVTIEAKPPTRPQSAKRSPRHKDMVHYTGMTPNGNRDRLFHSADSRELSLLLKAVLELDESAKQTLRAGISPDSAKKVLFRRPGTKPQYRKNMSFSNDRVRQIDGENERLLGQILVRNQQQRPKKKAVVQEPKLLSHAALNRARQQRTIERENFEMLKRIRGAKPTSYLKKDSLLKDHERQLTYGLQVSNPATPERPLSGKRQRPTVHVYSHPTMGSRSSSMSSLQSSGLRSRPGSGRPLSAKRPPERARPAWDDRFYIPQE